MPGVKISELPLATGITGAEQIELSQDGGSARASLSDVLAALGFSADNILITSLTANPLQIPGGDLSTAGLGFVGNGMGWSPTTVKNVNGTANPAIATVATSSGLGYYAFNDNASTLISPLDLNGDLRSWGGDGGFGNPFMVQTLANANGTGMNGFASYSAWNPSTTNGGSTEPFLLLFKSRGEAIGSHDNAGYGGTGGGALQFADSTHQIQWCGETGVDAYNDYVSCLSAAFSAYCGIGGATKGNVPGYFQWQVVPTLGKGFQFSQFTASVSASTTATVSALASGSIEPGQYLLGLGVTAGRTVSARGTSTGGAGTITLSGSETWTSRTILGVRAITGCGIFAGSISGTTLTVSSVAFGFVFAGHIIVGVGLTAGLIITAQLTGTPQGAGTYSLSADQGTVGASAFGTYKKGSTALTPTLATDSNLALYSYSDFTSFGKQLNLKTGYALTGGGAWTSTWENGTAPQSGSNIVIGTWNYRGYTDASVGASYIQKIYTADVVTDNAEQGSWSILHMLGGSITTAVKIGGAGGMAVGAPTGGLKGSGSINLDTVLYVDGTQVVGPRVTGYAAMTGSANKAATYDTASVTLAQLAGRVMQLQADLTTHGLIGA